MRELRNNLDFIDHYSNLISKQALLIFIYTSAYLENKCKPYINCPGKGMNELRQHSIFKPTSLTWL